MTSVCTTGATRAQAHVQSAKTTREDASSSDARSAIYVSERYASIAKENHVNQRFSISAGTAKVTSFAYPMNGVRSDADGKQAEPGTASEAVDARNELVSSNA